MSWHSSNRESKPGPLRSSTRAAGLGSETRGEAIESEDRLTAKVEERVREERAELARFKELFEQRKELFEELERLRRERFQAEQKAQALDQRVEREQRRSERFVVSADGSRRGRPVRIEVDDEAWATLKRDALRRKVWLVSWIGDLIRIEVEALGAGEVSGRPSLRRRRSPGEDDPQPQQRFLRIDVDDDGWNAFRVVALDVGLTVGRYVGELAEVAAYESGWRSGTLQSG